MFYSQEQWTCLSASGIWSNTEVVTGVHETTDSVEMYSPCLSVPDTWLDSNNSPASKNTLKPSFPPPGEQLVSYFSTLSHTWCAKMWTAKGYTLRRRQKIWWWSGIIVLSILWQEINKRRTFFLREAVLVALDIGISVHSYQTHDAARISGHPHTKRLVGLKGVGWSHRLQS